MLIDLVPNASDAPPQWVDLAVVGEWRGHPTGVEKITPVEIASMLNAFGRHYAANGAQLVVDYDHQTLVSKITGKPAPAAGWVSQMRVTDGGNRLQGLVRWNDPARELISKREYRYLSPVYGFQAPDRVTGQPIPAAISSVALVNVPFLTELHEVWANSASGVERATGAQAPSPVNAESAQPRAAVNVAQPAGWRAVNSSVEDQPMTFEELSAAWDMPPEDCAKALGLGMDAAPADIAAAVAKLAKKSLGAAEAPPPVANAAAGGQPPPADPTGQARAPILPVNSAVANALGVAADASEVDVKAAILSLKAADARQREIANALGLSPEAELDAILGAAQALRQGDKKDRAAQLVANAVTARKVTPASAPWWVTQALADFESTERVLRDMPAVLAPVTDAVAVANAAGAAGTGFLALVERHMAEKKVVFTEAVRACRQAHPVAFKAAREAGQI